MTRVKETFESRYTRRVDKETRQLLGLDSAEHKKEYKDAEKAVKHAYTTYHAHDAAKCKAADDAVSSAETHLQDAYETDQNALDAQRNLCASRIYATELHIAARKNKEIRCTLKRYESRLHAAMETLTPGGKKMAKDALDFSKGYADKGDTILDHIKGALRFLADGAALAESGLIDWLEEDTNGLIPEVEEAYSFLYGLDVSVR